MKKRFFSLLTSLIMVISLVGVVPSMSASAYTSGDYEYFSFDDGTVEIIDYYGSATNLTIPSTIDDKSVTRIGALAFEDCTSLTSVTIPSSVTCIGDFAFWGCASLTSVTIPNSITSIGEGTFHDCTSLASVTIPNSVTKIGDRAFAGCTCLPSISIPTSVTYIGDNAFYNCKSLKSVTIPNSVTIIRDLTFAGCTSLKRVIIPDNVTSIGLGAFCNCTSLKSVTIPNSVTCIGESAFENSSLTNITLPNSDTSIGDNAFYNCPNLKAITIPKSVTNIYKCAFGYYDNDGNSMIKVPGFKIKCYKGTAGEQYAKDNGFDYELIDQVSNVTGFKASSTSANAVKLTWKKSSGANGYVVYRYNTSTKKYGRIAKITSNTYTDKKLKSGTSYKYAVRAYKTVNGKELLSTSYPQIATSTNPATVSFKLTAGSKKATVKWSKVTGASGYKIYYKTSKNGKWVGLKTVNNKTTNYTKTKLASKKTYYFTVKAYRTTSGKTYNGAYTSRSIKIK